MKTLKTLTAAVLMALSFSAFANYQTGNEKLKLNYALQAYIDAMSIGKINGFADILDSDVKFSMTKNNTIIHYNKSEILTFIRDTKGIKQNCSTAYDIVEQTPTQAVVKVIMKYPTFSKVTFLCLANSSNGWKITNVSNSYINDK